MKFINLLSSKNQKKTGEPVSADFLGDSITPGAFKTYRGHNTLTEGNYDYLAVYHALLARMLTTIYPAVHLM
jgi:hypothetical protein